MGRRAGIVGGVVALLVMGTSLVSCSEPDSDRATEIFVDCLQRNGVEAEDVEVTLDSDGTVASISAVILSEGDVAYEPALRMACTEEVELNQ